MGGIIMPAKMLILCIGLLMQSLAMAQSAQNLDYNYAELRFVDVDAAGGNGFRLNGSYRLDNNWLIVGGITGLDFNNNVDSSTLEIGGGYAWNYSRNFDVVSSLRFVRIDVDTPFGGGDDNGFVISAGPRGWVAPKFEVRGSINHINLDNSDTYLELAGDYHFSPELAAGASLEFAGDADVFTIGVRWFF